MKELIEKKVLGRNWTFNEISNLNDTVLIYRRTFIQK